MKTSTSNLTLEQKVGQLFMVGFPGTKVTPEVRHLFRDLCFGGVILFKRNMQNPKQTRALIWELKEIALEATGLPLFVAVDEEGGPIVRLPKGSTIFPGPMALAATRSIANVRAVAKATAQELKSLGFNLNFAPVMDVASDPRNPTIGVRSFGEDPALVSQCGTAYIKAFQSQGVLATAKHFPGLGACTQDPHITLPMVQRSADLLEKVDWPPFRTAFISGVSGVMVSNAWFPALEPKVGFPACLSRPIVSGLLRERLGFAGLIFSDDLEMGAVSRRFFIPEAALLSLRAGCDQLLICHRPRIQNLSYQRVLSAFREKEFPGKRLEASLLRIQKAKHRLGLKTGVSLSAAAPLCRRIAEKSLTLVKCDQPLIPLPRKLNGPLGLILPEVSRVVPMDPGEEPVRTLAPLLSSRYEVSRIRIGIEPSRDDFRRANSLAHGSSVVIFGSYNTHQARFQARLVSQLFRLNHNLIVVSLRNPYDLALFPEVPCFLAAYSFRRPAMEALAKVLLGEIKPKGVLPVTIPRI